MKTKNILIVGIICAFFISCEKIFLDCCIDNKTGSPENSLLDPERLNTVKHLFDVNDVDYSDLQVFNYWVNDFSIKNVYCNQYVNGLKIIGEEIHYTFDENNKLISRSQNRVDDMDLEAKAAMRDKKVVRLFIEEIENDGDFMGDINEIKSHCIEVELGFSRNNRGSNDFNRIWIARPEGASFPLMYLNDETKEIINYDNGIRN